MKKAIRFIIYLSGIIISGLFLSSAFSAFAALIGLNAFNEGSVLLILDSNGALKILFKTNGFIISWIAISLLAILFSLYKSNREKDKVIQKLNTTQPQSIRITKTEDTFIQSFKKFSQKYITHSLGSNLFGIQLYKFRLEGQGDKLLCAVDYLGGEVASGKSLSTRPVLEFIDINLFLEFKTSYEGGKLANFISKYKGGFEERTQVPQKDNRLIFFLLRVANVIENNIDAFLKENENYTRWMKKIKDNGKLEALLHNSITKRPYFFQNGEGSKCYVAWHYFPNDEDIVGIDDTNESNYMIIMAFTSSTSDKKNQKENYFKTSADFNESLTKFVEN